MDITTTFTPSAAVYQEPTDSSARRWVLETLSRYWSHGRESVARLPFPRLALSRQWSIPPLVQEVSLPSWAADIAVDGVLLAPRELIASEGQVLWTEVDWIGTAFWYLHACAERRREEIHGTVHSFSHLLDGFDGRLWDRAWANRVALFLRRYAARTQNVSEETLFGPLPSGRIVLTHDVDAVRKTLIIRAKQGVFHAFNAGRAARNGDLSAARDRLGSGLRFVMGKADYWRIPELLELEQAYGVSSRYHFYAGSTGWLRHPVALLLDPSYDCLEPHIRDMARRLHSLGHEVGLHPSVLAWNDTNRLRTERERLESAVGRPVCQCRMHWLRFSFQQTWQAMEEAGFEEDATLAFNDRPGFRNGAAIRLRPFDEKSGSNLQLSILPTVLMDSHLYDYGMLLQERRTTETRKWLWEVLAVGGEAAVIWHQRVLSPDYGWGEGYRDLLKMLSNPARFHP